MYSYEDSMIAKPLTMKLLRTQQLEPTLQTGRANELDLVHRIAGKDESALQQLYAIHGRGLYAYALRLTGDAAQAEDVVQDVLVAVWQKAGSYRGEGRLISWLLGIVHHTAVKSLRRRSIPITEEMEINMQTTDPLPEDLVQADERSRSIREGLEELSAEHRAVLELFFYQGLSLEETAEVCGCPVGTVKSRLSYARQHLRRVLSRMEETP
jgi:RNA polymerase sigma-70 factor (ECF subfamily)